MIICREYLAQFIEDNYPPEVHGLGELTMVDFINFYYS